MKRIILQDNWKLIGIRNTDLLTNEKFDIAKLKKIINSSNLQFDISYMPLQVHDILYSHGYINNPNIKGVNNDLWIDDCDWVYICEFSVSENTLPSFLMFEGLDTFVDVYLNDVKICNFENAYIQQKSKELTNLMKYNTLMLYFHSSKKQVNSIKLPKKYKNMVPRNSSVRVFRSGFHDYNGPIPSLIRCGVYANVILMQIETLYIDEWKIEAKLDQNLSRGIIKCDLVVRKNNYAQNSICHFKIFDDNDILIAKKDINFNKDRVQVTYNIENPKLWWPRTLGDSNMYKVCLILGDEKGDYIEKYVGFRDLELIGDFDFRVNSHPLKLWGVNLAHLDTMTNTYQPEKMIKLLDLIELSNSNVIRVWGEGEIINDEFYNECDRRGILVWQDFYLGHSMYSEEEKFLLSCKEEAEQLVKKLRHHPCILLWCGGNEVLLSRDYNYPENYCFGEALIFKIFPKVCEKYDPNRYYHPTSPYGGNFTNDPTVGDTHGYTHLWFVPERNYPIFLSENCRVSTPSLKTMKKMMSSQDLWPSKYNNIVTRDNLLPWPESWNYHNTNDGAIKLGPIENYYDASNPNELVYKIGAAHAEYIRKDVERFRRGRDVHDKEQERKTKGHLLWKLNNNSNIISYGVVDYFLEPYYPYYSLKRSYSPILISCDFSQHVFIWITNDTRNLISGSISVSLFDIEKNIYVAKFNESFCVNSDESSIVTNLDRFGQFKKNLFVCVKAYDENGKFIADCIDVFEIERHIPYPTETNIKLIKKSNTKLEISSKTFARCVELIGDDEGDEFGWLFSDNYFDLLPNEPKIIKILKAHEKGIIKAKAIYDKKFYILEL